MTATGLFTWGTREARYVPVLFTLSRSWEKLRAVSSSVKPSYRDIRLRSLQDTQAGFSAKSNIRDLFSIKQTKCIFINNSSMSI
jgi:hypothetical protein